MTPTTIDVRALYSTLDAERQRLGLSWRGLAGEIGVSSPLLSRIGKGQKPHADGFATIVAWIGLPAENFFVSGCGEDPGRREEPDLLTELTSLLWSRDDLSPADVAFLQSVVGAALERVRASD
jgi:transcriptional regulator with XRE-family HTH domain